eukprot:COSAG05_NODE_21630_length_270_cov_0.912281_1_plen_32_part_10
MCLQDGTKVRAGAAACQTRRCQLQPLVLPLWP